MIRVLFVCLGNICRSPMAEAVFLQMVENAGWSDQIEVDSAGTGDWHIGSAPHDGTLEILRQNGVPVSSRARQIRASDLDEFNYLIVMDSQNLRDVQRLATGRAHLARLLDFVPQSESKDVPDPYFSGDFAQTFDLVRRGCQLLLQQICEQNALKTRAEKGEV